MKIKMTDRRKQILAMCCLSDKQIAERLLISLSTVKAHFRDLRNYFEVTNRAQLIAKGLTENIIQPDEIIWH